MMRIRILVFIFVFAVANAFGQNSSNISVSPGCVLKHPMGGDISVLNDSIGKYTISMNLYRDTADLGLLITDYIKIFHYDSTQAAYLFDSLFYVTLDSNLTNSLRPYFPPGEEMGIYKAPINLAPGKYRFLFQSCCRNPLVLNTSTPGSEQVIFYADLDVKSNQIISTPNCKNFAVGYFAINRAATFNPLPETFDADSISWSVIAPYGQYPYTSYVGAPLIPVSGFYPPFSDPNGPFTMNPYSGEIKWTPNLYGDFTQSLEIDKFRNGEQVSTFLRDMQFVVVSSGGASSMNFTPISPVNYDTTGDFNYIIYTPGTPLSFQINAYCPGSPMKFNAYSTVLNLASNPASFGSFGFFDSTSGTFSWTPPTGFSDRVVVVFRLISGSFVKDYTLLLLNAPLTYTNLASVNQSLQYFTLYPNPAHTLTNLSLNLVHSINASVAIKSVLGKEVSNSNIGTLETGKHNIQLNTNLPAGTYFVILKDNGMMLQAKTLIIE
jgi:Secretion system C-terminal sorting domain